MALSQTSPHIPIIICSPHRQQGFKKRPSTFNPGLTYSPVLWDLSISCIHESPGMLNFCRGSLLEPQVPSDEQCHDNFHNFQMSRGESQTIFLESWDSTSLCLVQGSFLDLFYHFVALTRKIPEQSNTFPDLNYVVTLKSLQLLMGNCKDRDFVFLFYFVWGFVISVLSYIISYNILYHILYQQFPLPPLLPLLPPSPHSFRFTPSEKKNSPRDINQIQYIKLQ